MCVTDLWPSEHQSSGPAVIGWAVCRVGAASQQVGSLLVSVEKQREDVKLISLFRDSMELLKIKRVTYVGALTNRHILRLHFWLFQSTDSDWTFSLLCWGCAALCWTVWWQRHSLCLCGSSSYRRLCPFRFVFVVAGSCDRQRLKHTETHSEMCLICLCAVNIHSLWIKKRGVTLMWPYRYLQPHWCLTGNWLLLLSLSLLF